MAGSLHQHARTPARSGGSDNASRGVVETLWDLAGDASPLKRAIPVTPPEPPPARATESRLVVLASGSSGNCSVLIHGRGRNVRVTMIDAGLSPTRTRKLLGELGLTLDRVDEILFTHLDADHAHKGWVKALPEHARFWIHRRHRGRAGRDGFLRRHTRVFEDQPFLLSRGVRTTPVMLAHDELGVAAFRFDWFGERNASLGYATDLGRVTPQLVEALRGVDVLAIESNYCPALQAESDRPAFLKERIMNGSGHLSNEECRRAVCDIAPARELVLLHLSRQCNTPELASRYHSSSPWAVTVSSQTEMTRPIPIAL